MKLRLILTAVLSSFLTLAVVEAVPALSSSVKLENARVKVSEIIYTPGAERSRYTRQSDQVIVFLDDCRYERTDSTTQEKTIRERKSGDVIWHSKGEDAPVLRNLGSKAYRTLLIELK
ncbi:MAG TPA: hypothetical protein VHC90_14810 [Bryobacteraceae bacterium]|jgi:hypothetical protein|nr:hypothetical protein [Bryobacteraceae bacterium]